ncbi:SWI/SNF-related matrix-associated actin-dependent regulator of chromatin subfamily E member 1-related-like [Acipenser oxyrinchus oxyrinchus]|uniref:SWI/SNF-related matrix-associated actin-dependent regulator of chromatin subfamily E member 1-related-like n=1 Tax=Acipenser oxyrinchus oxyrinchus TaxID=40147 RepID=A0AAD8LUL2_ACIOX|nr:SWI/SNF-related matrix-associated actin-dependent regulator of chromatin subfamily E member 1-related-like [Acipenser oxyrinchus oxyrinchus]
MNLDSSLGRALTVVTPIPVTGFDLTTIQHLQLEESAGLCDSTAREAGAGFGVGNCSNVEDGGSGAPAAFIDGVPVTVSVQNVDGQHRIVCVAADASGSTVSYVGQLNSDVNLELQAEVPSMPLQYEDGVLPLAPGTQLLPIHPLNAALEPVQNIILDGQLQSKDPDTEEPKKRKGGWPKGKKRKPPNEFSAPRAPTTGYVIFVNEKKVHLKAEHPDIPFTEITKMLGTRWSQLSQEEKQKYNNAAEKDKQRFIEELQAYQNSEAYKAFLKRKALHKVKVLCGVEMVDSEFENEIVALSQMDGGDTSDLYCRTCNQYFSSLHNKKEHLLGKQHLQNLTEEFEKETVGLCKEQQDEGEEELEAKDEDSEEEEVAVAELAQLCGLASQHSFTSLDLGFLQEFIFKQMTLREFELGELNTSMEKAMEKHDNLNRQLEDLQKQKLNLESELGSLKAHGGTLETQLDSLKMVPMLLKFHIEITESGNAVLQKQSIL